MTVYVDKLASAYQKDGLHRMFADTPIEAHRAAASVGASFKKWDDVQSLYFVSNSQRALLVCRRAAEPVSKDEATAMLELRSLWGLLPPVEAARAYLSAKQSSSEPSGS